jgi:hypothetical protein
MADRAPSINGFTEKRTVVELEPQAERTMHRTRASPKERNAVLLTDLALPPVCSFSGGGGQSQSSILDF